MEREGVQMTETAKKDMIKVGRPTYLTLSTMQTKIEAIVNQNRPRHKIPISFDQVIQICVCTKGVNEQLEEIQIEAGL
jgi:hypothetical protein